MRKRPLILLACVFLAGLVYQKYSFKAMVVVVLLALLGEIWFGRQTKNYSKVAGRSVLLLSAFLLGVFHMQQEQEFRAAYMSKIVDGSQVTVWGELIKWETVEYGNRGILSDCYISLGNEIIPCNNLMVYTSNDQYKLGQIHKITGKVNRFTGARNEGNFDSRLYYQSLKIDFAIDEEGCVVLGNAQGAWKEILYGLREKMRFVYETCLSSKAAGFYQAMVLGDKTDLERSLKELFLIGGISHILAISGLHISIIGRGMYQFLRKYGISFAVAGICGSILLVVYCIMVGASVSTVRAVGMMLLFFLAQWMGRSYDMLNALGGMVIILLWTNPFLIENSGFWFSVTALLGVGVVGKELCDKGGERTQKKKSFRKYLDGLYMSLGITLTTLPITALSYFELPFYSPLVNFIVLPLLAPVFLLALCGGLLGALGFWQGGVVLMLQPCNWLLGFYEWVCKKIALMPAASLICGKPDTWQVVLYYIILFGGIRMLQCLRMDEKMQRKRNISARVIVTVTIFISCNSCILFPKPQNFEITFLDVGQGDGVYISGGDGTTYFIDGGSSSVNEVGTYRILPFLKAKGVNEIDYWFVSHCDTDHISGLLEILESRYKIGYLVLPGPASKSENELRIVHAAKQAGVELIYMNKGESVCSRDMKIMCLGPLEEMVEEKDTNEKSLVLQVEWKSKEKEFKALFAGDISIAMENELCERGLLSDVDLFKANHHGSNYSNGDIFLRGLKPEYIVVSCSKNNSYGHPGQMAMERMEASGAEIFYTMDGGQITFPLIQYSYENNRQ